MGIEITAPEKFDFQDLACLELALRLDTSAGLVMFAEPEYGEDAELRFESEGQSITLEVQVKGAAGEVHLSDLAEWLLHFPKRKTVNCLLERLISNEFVTVLLIVSGRCNDAVSVFVVDPEWTGKAH